MRKMLLAAVIAVVPAVAAAQIYGQGYRPYDQGAAPAAPHSSYDWRSGNMYQTTPNADGSTTVHGSNARNGTIWNSTIRPNGDEHGFDSHGDSWNYNAQTGAYNNSNGHGCIGQGYARSCW